MLIPIMIAAALQAAVPVPQAESPAATAKAAAPETPAAEIARLRAENAELTIRIARADMVADNARQQVETLRDEAKLKDELLALGQARNADLYKLGSEILDQYQHKGLGKVISGNEPFLQTSRVKLENLVQDYEDKLRAARFTETTLPPSVEERMKRDLQKPAGETPAATLQN